MMHRSRTNFYAHLAAGLLVMSMFIPSRKLMAQPVITYQESTQTQKIYAFVSEFYSAGDARLHVNYWDGTQWRWADQGAPADSRVVSNPGVITYPEGGKQRIYAFVSVTKQVSPTVGHEQYLFVNWWDGSQWKWADQGVIAGGDPSVVTYQDPITGKRWILAFVTGSRNRPLSLNYWDGGNWRTIGNLGSLYGPVGLASYPEAGMQRVRYFGQNAQRLYEGELQWNTTRTEIVKFGFFDHGSPPNGLNSNMGVVDFLQSGTQWIYVFGIGTNGHLYVRYWNGQQWNWSDQGTPPGTIVAHRTPGVVTYLESGRQRIRAFVTGANGRLYENHWNGVQWSWIDHGTPPGKTVTNATPWVITYPKAANVLGEQPIHVFLRGSDAHIYRHYNAPGLSQSQWQWADQGRP